ncbi:MAG: HIT family protein [Planctomycetes bacterium]|nr:HIT family protein [Planctomycetota bacterium]
MAADPQCIFCKIVAGEIPSARVAESDTAYAFMDIGPIATGHTLVVPKDHYVGVEDAPPEVVAAVHELASRIAPALKQAVGAEGLNVLQNNGHCAGQVVMHLHVHLIPRWGTDGLDWPWPSKQADPAELKRIAGKVAAMIG